jgi:hypothetical protein
MDVTYRIAAKAVPKCVAIDQFHHKTLADLQWAVQIELDLTEEGQDGTNSRNIKPLKRWLQRFGSPLEG